MESIAVRVRDSVLTGSDSLSGLFRLLFGLGPGSVFRSGFFHVLIQPDHAVQEPELPGVYEDNSHQCGPGMELPDPPDQKEGP